MITTEHLMKLCPDGVSFTMAVSRDKDVLTLSLTPKGKQTYPPIVWTGTKEQLELEIPKDIDEIAAGTFATISNAKTYAETIKTELDKPTTSNTAEKKAVPAAAATPTKPPAKGKAPASKKPALPAKKEEPAKKDLEPEGSGEFTLEMDEEETTVVDPGHDDVDAGDQEDAAAETVSETATEPAAEDVKIDLPEVGKEDEDDDAPPTLF